MRRGRLRAFAPGQRAPDHDAARERDGRGDDHAAIGGVDERLLRGLKHRLSVRTPTWAAIALAAPIDSPAVAAAGMRPAPTIMAVCGPARSRARGDDAVLIGEDDGLDAVA